MFKPNLGRLLKTGLYLSDSIFSSHGNVDVSEQHEIQLGDWHHVRIATHVDHQKNHFGKYFPAILGLKWTKHELQYCNEEAKWVK